MRGHSARGLQSVCTRIGSHAEPESLDIREMKQQGTASRLDNSFPPVCILIPAYGAADKLRCCLEALLANVPGRADIHVIDDATPGDDLQTTLADLTRRSDQLHFHRNPTNLGFIGTCNWGMATLRTVGSDLLLLNSDTEVTNGFLEEMQTVLYLNDRHAVAVPRSNSATIFTYPATSVDLTVDESHHLWRRTVCHLPRYQVMPTAVGFCMLIKSAIVDRFGLFDEIYSPGYNEENDFICRINRCGYSVVAANHAYVFHYEGSSFSDRKVELESRNSQVLLSRYPEYSRKVDTFNHFQIDPLERFAHRLLSTRRRILVDLWHLPAVRCGTSEFALNLLRECSPMLEEYCDIYIGIGDALEHYADELRGYRIYNEAADGQLFDLAFKPSQIWTWGEFDRLNRLAPRLCYVLLDMIAVRCDYLTSIGRQVLFRKVAELSDRVFTISFCSRDDFNSYYGGDGVDMTVIHLGTDMGQSPAEFRHGSYVLIIGNNYPHKGVESALEHLNGFPTVVLGGEPPFASGQNVRWIKSGGISGQMVHELFIDARIVVYPSHYEGFGLPVVDSLALNKPVIVLNNAIGQEIRQLTSDPNLHLIESYRRLPDLIASLFPRNVRLHDQRVRRWRDVAVDYCAALKEMLSTDIDIDRLRRRWDILRLLHTFN